MAKHYKHALTLSRQISLGRRQRTLSFEQLGILADVNAAQVFRICRGEFKTLNPSVLRICNVLCIQPEGEGMTLRPSGNDQTESMLSAEVLTAWDRTEAGAMLLKRVLRALHPAR